MAHLSTHNSFSPGLRARLDAFFAAVGQGMNAYIEARSRKQELDRLYNMSDVDLAKMGLKREDIPRHVFRDLFYL